MAIVNNSVMPVPPGVADPGKPGEIRLALEELGSVVSSFEDMILPMKDRLNFVMIQGQTVRERSSEKPTESHPAVPVAMEIVSMTNRLREVNRVIFEEILELVSI